ncbi:MAG: HAD family hydrolase [Erysipelotrichaceae bacterium]|nr:HAD family hydrolase [Erysipelotrichaceae bacterium]
MGRIKLALIYDFDKTLSPRDMQEYHLIGKLGYDNPDDFWKRCGELTEEQNVDGILSYMYMIAKEDPNLTKDDLIAEGQYIKLYPGVSTWFDRINEYGLRHGIDIEHYIISSGIKEIIQGTSIAKEFKEIYACSYCYDSNGKVLWPSRSINYTMKTQYLFRINNGVFDERNDRDLNRSTPDDEKYLPYDHMIYFGDGMTDVPSMKVVNSLGGYTIAVFGQGIDKKKLAEELYDKRRAAFMAKADYSKGSKIERIVQGIIDSVESKARLEEFQK